MRGYDSSYTLSAGMGPATTRLLRRASRLEVHHTPLWTPFPDVGAAAKPGHRLFSRLGKRRLPLTGQKWYNAIVCSVRLPCPTGSADWLNRYRTLRRPAHGAKRRTDPNGGRRSERQPVTHL